MRSMMIEDITSEAIEEASVDELRALRLRCMQIYKKHLSKGDSDEVDLTRDELMDNYGMVIAEIRKRGLVMRSWEIDVALFKRQAEQIQMLKDAEPVDIYKPYPGEHACPMRSPDDFQTGEDNWARVERTSGGKRYSIIMGRLKGKTSMTEQSYRYNKEVWSEAAARKHCQDHDGMKFEPAEESKSVEKFVRFVEKREDEQIVTGVVYEPNETDTQGDYSTAEEIMKAAYSFMENGQQFQMNHAGKDVEAVVLENYLAPVAFDIGEEHIKKGTWILTSRVKDIDIWKRIKSGEITGYSMRGTAMARE
jgi:hypothetical protein